MKFESKKKNVKIHTHMEIKHLLNNQWIKEDIKVSFKNNLRQNKIGNKTQQI